MSPAPLAYTTITQPEPEANLTLHTPGYWEVPEVPEGHIHETVFVWMRFLHCAIVPSVIFILNKVVLLCLPGTW